MDLNADLGEGCANDAQLMPLIARANIACGGHVGDESSMSACVRLALQHNVKVGAHPSYLDREHFGRRETGATPLQIEQSCTTQLAAFLQVTSRYETDVSHVKAHGALYHRVAEDRQAAAAFLRAVKAVVGGSCAIMGLPGSLLQDLALAEGHPFIAEMFADRRYEDNGSLTPRHSPDALITSLDESVAQVLSVRDSGLLTTRTGIRIKLMADTVCVHGDGEQALALARALHRLLTVI